MMRFTHFVLLLLGLVALLGLFFAFAPTAFTWHELVLANRRGGDVFFHVRIADDEPSRRRGLQHVKSLGEREGMWFVFPDEAPRVFWMKETLLPLDILFLDASKTIVSTHFNVPPCRNLDPTEEICPTYPSNVPAQFVLELAGGTAQRYGLQLGDMLELRP